MSDKPVVEAPTGAGPGAGPGVSAGASAGAGLGASVYTRLGEGLDVMPPGPELAAVLAGLDRALFNGYQLVVLLQARQRQIAWEQAQLLADMHELTYSARGRFADPPRRRSWSDPHITEEVSFALSWTRATAERQGIPPEETTVIHPAVYSASLPAS